MNRLILFCGLGNSNYITAITPIWQSVTGFVDYLNAAIEKGEHPVNQMIGLKKPLVFHELIDKHALVYRLFSDHPHSGSVIVIYFDKKLGRWGLF